MFHPNLPVESGISFLDDGCIDVDLTHVVDDHSHLEALSIGEYVIEEGCLARTYNT